MKVVDCSICCFPGEESSETPPAYRPRCWTRTSEIPSSLVIPGAIFHGGRLFFHFDSPYFHFHFLSRHCYSVLDKFLQQNIEWTKEVGDWELCRTMSVRIIAVHDNKEFRDLEKCVTGTVDGVEKVVIQGPVPIPRWAKRKGHTQASIDRWIESVAGFEGTRDLGLDGHDDAAWEVSGGSDQNRPPPGAWASDMTGCLTGPANIGQYEPSSSDSEVSEISEGDLEVERSSSTFEDSEDFSRPFVARTER